MTCPSREKYLNTKGDFVEKIYLALNDPVRVYRLSELDAVVSKELLRELDRYIDRRPQYSRKQR